MKDIEEYVRELMKLTEYETYETRYTPEVYGYIRGKQIEDKFRSILKAVREEGRHKHFVGIERWAEMAWEESWLNAEQWTAADEVSASIQSYASGDDLSSNSKEV